jgi:hypothetical protein
MTFDEKGRSYTYHSFRRLLARSQFGRLQTDTIDILKRMLGAKSTSSLTIAKRTGNG